MSLNMTIFLDDGPSFSHLIVEVHGVGDVKAELGGVEAVMAGHLVVGVELPSLLARLIYHIVVDVRVVS